MTPNGTSPSALNSSGGVTAPAPRTNRRYKTQLRDFLSTCRSKRKVSGAANPQQPNQNSSGQLSSPSSAVVDYIPDPAAVAVAYSNLNPMYSSSPVPYGAASSENLYMTQSIHSGSFYPSAENLFHQYRLQGGYYPDYHHHHHHHPSSPYVANGFLPYDGYGLASPVVNAKEEKWHDEKFYNNSSGGSSDLSHTTNGRHNFNYEQPTSSQQPVNAYTLTSKTMFHVNYQVIFFIRSYNTRTRKTKLLKALPTPQSTLPHRLTKASSRRIARIQPHRKSWRFSRKWKTHRRPIDRTIRCSTVRPC